MWKLWSEAWAVQEIELCPGYGKVCNKCLTPNHFVVKCFSHSAKGKQILSQVQVIDEDDPDEVFSTQISAVKQDDSQLVMLKLESENFVRFHVNTGAQCNVIPVALYQMASGDFKMTQMIPARTTITAYEGLPSQWPEAWFYLYGEVPADTSSIAC